MDRYSFCGYNCDINNCTIGSFCSIANNVIIGGANHPMTWVSTSPVFYSGKDSVHKKFSNFLKPADACTYIENDVWIGQNAIIKQGVTIGNGAIVGMGSIVTKDVEPYSIVAGNPAHLIRYRFSQKIIHDLESSKWWKLSDDVLQKAAVHIQNPDQFIKWLNDL